MGGGGGWQARSGQARLGWAHPLYPPETRRPRLPAHGTPSPHCCCPLPPCRSDLDDTDLESDSEDGRPQHGGGGGGGDDDESLPGLEPNEGAPGGASLRDVDTGTEFGMEVRLAGAGTA